MKNEILFRQHALKRMFERNISRDSIIEVLATGEIIEEYPEDKPYPSCLKMKVFNLNALHVVMSYDSDNNLTIVITAYWADKNKWDNSFKRRKK